MAKRNEISIGSQGSDVSELQKKLIDNGYQLAVDGIFGAKTQQAVRDYQKKMGLAVDGIVGVNTWGALDKAADKSIGNPNIGTKTVTVPTATAQTATNAYKPSDAVTQAQAMLQQQLASKPGAYQSQWQAGLDEIMNKILNRENFSYDLNGDALYQQYKDQYTLQGQQAMMDTMGQAQAMTGGYGNSYAQTVGQQVYQGHMQQLNDKIPELYQLALDQYNREGDEMYQQYGLLADRENQDYGRYQDSLDNWNTAYNQAYQKYQDERNYDYGKYTDDRNYQYQVDRDAVSDQQWAESLQYQKDRDAVADAQWQKEFDEAKRQYDQQYGLKTASASSSSGSSSSSSGSSSGGSSSGGSSGGGSGSGGSGSGSGYDNGNVSTSSIKILQKALGVTADGKWGPESQAAANKKWGTTSADKALSIYNAADTSAGRSNQFNGSTYEDAVKYMKANGVTSAKASSAMTATEWTRRKNAGSSSAEVKNYSTYKEYLADFVEYQMSQK